MRVAGERFAFDEDVWTEEVGRFDAAGKAQTPAGESAGHRGTCAPASPRSQTPELAA